MSINTFDSNAYSPSIARILAPERLPELGPGSPNEGMRSALAALTPESLGPAVRDRSMALACISGLWLLHDFLDESHRISQDLESPTGSFWHAVMHRREPDAPNSKYWWARVGAHPVLELLKSEAAAIGYSYRNPEEFVDFCERVRGSGLAEEELARLVQLLEWRMLFDWCFQRSTVAK
jgi:hypothetical protein